MRVVAVVWVLEGVAVLQLPKPLAVVAACIASAAGTSECFANAVTLCLLCKRMAVALLERAPSFCYSHPALKVVPPFSFLLRAC